jgi:hypothetical protein
MTTTATQLAAALADMVAAFSWGDMNAGEAAALSNARQALAAFEAQAATSPKQTSGTSEPVTVTVERERVWIKRGVQSFMLAYEADTNEEREWYAQQLRGALAAPVAQAEPMTWDQFVKACEAEYGQDFLPTEAQGLSEHDKTETMRVVRMVETHHRIKENP